MKLIYNPLDITMELETGSFSLVIENPEEFEKFLLRLSEQVKGADQYFFTDEEKPSYFKTVSVITSPFDLVISEREIQKKLFLNIIQEIENTDMNERLAEIHGMLIECLDDLFLCSDFELDYDENYSLNSILKNFSVSLKKFDGNFCSKFISYADVMNRLLARRNYILFSAC